MPIDLTSAIVRQQPFTCFIAEHVISEELEQELLHWLEADAPWRLAVMDFYEQYEFDFSDVTLPPRLQPMFSSEAMDLLRLRLGALLGGSLRTPAEITAHRLNRSQKIRIHNDDRPDGETHRFLIQLNHGWTEDNGGLLMLFGGPDAESLDSIIPPMSRSAFGFRISTASYHAVSQVATDSQSCSPSMKSNLLVDCPPSSLLPPWDMRVPKGLGELGARTVLSPLGLSRDNYSTGRLLAKSLSPERNIIGTIHIGEGNLMTCEGFDIRTSDYARSRGLMATDPAEVPHRLEQVQNAVADVLSLVPSVLQPVSQLAWNFHLINAEGDDYDASYSDPAVPFSMFFSASPHKERRTLMRIAENIVHETMHLQLSLFEAMCPLVDPNVQWTLFSPWKQSQRQTQGIVHGLYVFKVLKWMWEQIVLSSTLLEDRSFATARIKSIDEELASVRGIELSPALTVSGKILVDAIFSMPSS
jgi:hypothetical protein